MGRPVGLAAGARRALMDLRTRCAGDPSFRRAVRGVWRRSAQASNTDAVTYALAMTFLPDLRREITLNDAIDFMHAAVPVAFCDAVRLDAAMHDMVGRARRQHPAVHMADTFSGRGDVALGTIGEARPQRFWVVDPDENGDVAAPFQKLLGPYFESRFRPFRALFSGGIGHVASALGIPL
jgi:hypothetical protein